MSAPILSLTSFRQWLETKPPGETYNFMDCSGCLVYQYLNEKGYPVKRVGVEYWRDHSNKTHSSAVMNELSNISVLTPPTFGAAFSRTIALEQEQSP